jgi:chromosome segregation ATPase
MAGLLDPLMLPLRLAEDVRRSLAVLPGLLRTVDAIGVHVRELHAELEPLPRGIERVSEQIDALGHDIVAMRADLAQTKRNVEPMDDDLAAVQESLEALGPKLDALREDLSGRLEQLRSDLGGLPFVGS